MYITGAIFLFISLILMWFLILGIEISTLITCITGLIFLLGFLPVFIIYTTKHPAEWQGNFFLLLFICSNVFIISFSSACKANTDILNAFEIIDQGIRNTESAIRQNNEEIYDELLPEKDSSNINIYGKARKIKQFTDETCDYIHQLKVELIMKTDGKSAKEAEEAVSNIQLIEGKDSYDMPTHIMVGDGMDPEDGKAWELKEKLIKYKEVLTTLILVDDSTKADSGKNQIPGFAENWGINTDDPELPTRPVEKHWETNLFYHTPLIAVIMILSKLHNDVRNAEAQALRQLMNDMHHHK